jgi:hypothetical protein
MKHVFIILLCLTALGCITFVGWQFAQPALTGSAETTYVNGDIVPNLENDKAPEQLLQERRELAKEVFNPSQELLAALLPKFINGELTGFSLEQDYVVPEDDFYEFLMQQDLLALAGPPLVPLTEPVAYRDSKIVSTSSGIIRYAVAASADGPVSVYAVDPDGAFSGILRVNEDLNLPVEQIRNVSPSSFVGDYGIYIDSGAPEKFNVMLKGLSHSIGTLYYDLHQEGAASSFTLPIITTPDMTASATWVTENNSPMFYKWRVDYDGDGVVDFLISHHDVMSENQAEEIIDFIVNSLPQDDTNREFYETNRTFLIESLTDIRFRNQG